MTDYDRGYARSIPAGRADMAVDSGLRAFMLGVYNKVALGLVLSGALAWVTSSVPAVRDALFVTTPTGALAGYTLLGMLIAFSPLVILLGSAFLMRSATPRSAGILYWTIVSLIGASLGTVFLRYTGESVASTFFITAAAFGALSLFGYTTKKDLSGLGTFLTIGLIGLILAAIVNIFIQSSMLLFLISAAGVLIFAGFTAYDTQRLKMTYYDLGGNQAALGVATSFGALSLYLDFINLFQFLLMFLGNNRD
jgi:FtsH-binding integral membrane protein